MKNIQENEQGIPYRENVEHAAIASVYPFKLPSQEIIDNTYVFTNPDSHLSIGYHTTGISALLRPREDKNVLVPGIALDASYPSLSMRFVVRGTLPVTQTNKEVPWFTWFGSKIVRADMMSSWDFSPEQAAEIVANSQEIRDMLLNTLHGREPDKEKLTAFFGQFLSGAWYRYYTGGFIDKILQSRDDPAVIADVEQTLAGVPERMAQAQEAYENLLEDPDAALLLRNKFKIVVQSKPAVFSAKGMPIVYCDKSISTMISNPVMEEDFKSRDPREILGFPMGVKADDITRIFFPDELEDPALKNVRTAFMNKVAAQGISVENLKPFSQYEEIIYDSCDLRYGKFTATSLKQLIQNGELVKLLG